MVQNSDNIYNNFYLNEVKIGAQRYFAYVLIGSSSLLFFLDLLFVVAGYTTSGLRGCLALALFLLPTVPFKVAAILWAVNILKRCDRSTVYGSILLEDHDGIITYDTIVSMTDYPADRVIKDLRWMVSKNIIINVRLSRTEVRATVMPDRKTEFYTVICPNCGNSIVMHAASGARCDHCGTYMIMKEN